jgi:hypothetical protein
MTDFSKMTDDELAALEVPPPRSLAPEPYDPFPGCDDCGGDDGWTRCQKHADMMKAIADVWYSDEKVDRRLLRAIWAESDGYGEPGFVPPQGYDWSGVRDSSPASIERMYQALLRHGRG